GARAYILKGHVHRELLETIRNVYAGKKRIPPEIAAELAEHAADDELTMREIEVLRLIGGGHANKQIADQLSIGEATVKSHVTNILSRARRLRPAFPSLVSIIPAPEQVPPPPRLFAASSR